MSIESINPYLLEHGLQIFSVIYGVVLLVIILVYLLLNFKKQNILLPVAIIFMSSGFVVQSSSFEFISGFTFIISGNDSNRIELLEATRKISSLMSYIGLGLLAYYAIFKYNTNRYDHDRNMPDK